MIETLQIPTCSVSSQNSRLGSHEKHLHSDGLLQTDRQTDGRQLEVRCQVRGVQVLLLLAVVGFPLCMCCGSNESPSRKTVSSPVDTFLPSTVSVNTSHTFSTENNNNTQPSPSLLSPQTLTICSIADRRTLAVVLPERPAQIQRGFSQQRVGLQRVMTPNSEIQLRVWRYTPAATHRFRGMSESQTINFIIWSLLQTQSLIETLQQRVSANNSLIVSDYQRHQGQDTHVPGSTLLSNNTDLTQSSNPTHDLFLNSVGSEGCRST